MYIYIYTHMHTYIHTYAYIYIHTCIHTYINTYIHTYTYIGHYYSYIVFIIIGLFAFDFLLFDDLLVWFRYLLIMCLCIVCLYGFSYSFVCFICLIICSLYSIGGTSARAYRAALSGSSLCVYFFDLLCVVLSIVCLCVYLFVYI